MRNRIEQLRKEKSLTLKDLANEFNEFTENHRDMIKPISYATLSRWEKGVNDPPFKSMEKLADYFDVPTPYLQGFGISRKTAINLMVFRIHWNEQNGFSSLTALDHLADLLEKKVTKSDIEYLKEVSNVNLDNESDGIVKKLVSDNNDEALRYLISKYLKFVNNYEFLASLPSIRNHTFYPKINDQIWQDNKDELLEYVLGDNNEILFSTVSNLSLLGLDTMGKIENFTKEQREEINYRLVLLFELLASDDDDDYNNEIRSKIIKLLDVYESGERKPLS
ncbi:helix-turn-helix domain-containing protein [Ligilactobacillus animalis]|uniref:helix-turn-helix domain-containing protein n=1 Tax=Ligilactobacillus animalis TaxID=1605 RepID=UPI0008264B89|nr:helix-turn-helix transcriptional regulator [Ligilactobacillus animalis]OCX47785.1 hypothetical protein BFC98_06060 [Ligilactobacillus animalis]QHQ70140.1 helix-turn-helix domain-containing protein [Ligilactobacillus animalis]